jgi:acetylornithine deacetylase
MKPGTYTELAVQLLRELISIPSVSRDEKRVADRVEAFLAERGQQPHRQDNNVWAVHAPSGGGGSEELPTILLNSHIDTVKPVGGWTRDPYGANVENGRIYGLGSNDAGASLVSMLFTFLHLAGKEDLPFNIIFAATAEEEVSGVNGVSSILDKLGNVDLGIVGEPTECKMAIAEKGLMVLDCLSSGTSAHAASGEGKNAIYESIADLEWFRNYRFKEESSWLGPVSMQVTQIEAGTQHNVVPDACRFVVDVRTNENYTNKEVYEIIKAHVKCRVESRSFRLNPSSIPESHALVRRGYEMGLEAFGSSTLSDQSLMPFTTIKIGPGESRRSHTADEYIRIEEIEQGIQTYTDLLSGLKI